MSAAPIAATSPQPAATGGAKASAQTSDAASGFESLLAAVGGAEEPGDAEPAKSTDAPDAACDAPTCGDAAQSQAQMLIAALFAQPGAAPQAETTVSEGADAPAAAAMAVVPVPVLEAAEPPAPDGQAVATAAAAPETALADAVEPMISDARVAPAVPEGPPEPTESPPRAAALRAAQRTIVASETETPVDGAAETPPPPAQALAATEAPQRPASPSSRLGAADDAHESREKDADDGERDLEHAVRANATGVAEKTKFKAREAIGPAIAEAAQAAVHDTAPQPGGPRPGPAEAPLAAATPALGPPAAVLARGAPETVANLAAQILKKLDGRTTRFDVGLDPAGLGRVDVHVEIGVRGQLTAALSFDNPHAAAELRGRASELVRSLEQAGFDLSGGLSFDVAGDRGQQGQGGRQNPDANPAWRGQAFLDALNVAGEADVKPAPPSLQRRAYAGLDIRI